MIAAVAAIIVCGRGMVICGTKMIGDVARIIISVTEKIESFIDLIVEGMEILVSQSSTIIDDVEIIVKETELIVTIVLSKGNTGGTETDERGVSDVKQSACLVCLGLFPFVDLGIDPHSERKSAKPRQTRAYSRSGAGLLHGGQF